MRRPRHNNLLSGAGYATLLLLLLLFATAPTLIHAQCSSATPLVPGAAAIAGSTFPNLTSWYSAQTSASGQVSIQITDVGRSGTPPVPAINYLVRVYDACGGNLLYEQAYNSNLPPEPGDLQLSGLPASSTVYVVVFQPLSQTGEVLTFNIRQGTSAVTNGTCGAAAALTLSPDPMSNTAVVAGGTPLSLFGASRAGSASGSCWPATATLERWYSLQVPASGSLVVGTQDLQSAPGTQTYRAKLAAFDACSGTELDCDNGFGNVLPDARLVLYNLTAGSTVLVSLSDDDAPPGFGPPAVELDSFELYAYDPTIATPANDLCAGATPLPCAAPTTGLINIATTGNYPGVSVCANGPGTGVWYSFVGDGTTQTLTLTPGPLSGDLTLTLASGSCNALSYVDCADDNGTGGTETLTYPTTVGEDYLVYVREVFNTSGPLDETFTIERSCDPCAPVFNVNHFSPASGTVLLGFQTANPPQTHTVEYGPIGFVRGGQFATTVTVPAGQTQVTLTGIPSSIGTDVYITPACGGNAFGPYVVQSIPPGPANELCSGATPITCGTTLTGVDNTAVTAAATAPGSCAVSQPLWYSFVGSGSPTTITLTPGTFSYDTKLAVLTGDCNNLVDIACEDGFFDETYTFTPTAGQTYYIAAGGSQPFGFGGSFDLQLTCTSCSPPLSVATTNITSTSATVTWVAQSTTSYAVEYGTGGFQPGNGLGTVINTAPGVGSVNITGLLPARRYRYYVTADCGAAPVGPIEFFTQATPLTCGDDFYDTGGFQDPYGADEAIVTEICPSLPTQVLTVTFTAFDVEDGLHFLNVYNGLGFGNYLTSATGQAIPGPFTATAPGECLTFQFLAPGNNAALRPGWEASVSCVTPSSCPAPTFFTATSTGPTTASLLWQSVPAATNGYVIEVGIGGFTPGVGAQTVQEIRAPGDVSATIAGLSGGIGYDAYIRSLCPGGNGDWGQPVSFTSITQFPTNDVCANALVLPVGAVGSCSAAASYTTVGAQTTVATSCQAGEGDVWFEATVPASGSITFSFDATVGTMGFGILEVYASCGGASLGCSGVPDEQGSVTLYNQTPGATLLAAVRPYFQASDEGTFAACATDGIVPVALASGCAPTVSAVVDGFGAPYVPFVDASGELIAVIGNTEDLGQVDVTVYGDAAAGLRQDANGAYFLDRQVAINVANQPTQPVEVIVFVTLAEVQAIIAADPTVATVADLQFAKVAGSATCTPGVPSNAQGVAVQVLPFGVNYGLVSQVTSFSEFFVAPTSAALPVELARFEAFAKTDHNLVHWSTASERDVAELVLEASTDGRVYGAIWRVLPKGVDGGGADYRHEDRDAAPTTYYRLRSVDLDGSDEYSEVLAVRRDGSVAQARHLGVTPNPASGTVTVTVTLPQNRGATAVGSEGEVLLVDAAGRVVLRRTVALGAGRVDLDLTGIAVGVYSVTLTGPAVMKRARLVVR